MRTLKFKAQPTNAFFATVNQMFGGSSQLPTTTEHCFVSWDFLLSNMVRKYRTARSGSAVAKAGRNNWVFYAQSSKGNDWQLVVLLGNWIRAPIWHEVNPVAQVVRKVDSAIQPSNNRGLGPVSRKPRKLFGPVKPFLIHLNLKTERCMRLKLLLWREPLFIFRICE